MRNVEVVDIALQLHCEQKAQEAAHAPKGAQGRDRDHHRSSRGQVSADRAKETAAGHDAVTRL